MSLVPYFKYMHIMLMNQPAYNSKESDLDGVRMDPKTHAFLVNSINDLKSRKNELFNKFPDQYLVAQAELIEEIKTTGMIPTIHLDGNRRVNLEDILNEFVEDEQAHNEEEKEEEEKEDIMEETKKAVSKPVKPSSAPKKRTTRKKKEVVQDTPIDPAVE